MQIILELNQKYKKGYQLRLFRPPTDSVLDLSPYTLAEAIQGAKVAVDEINHDLGTNYRLHEVLRIADEALQANRFTDPSSAKIYNEARKNEAQIEPEGEILVNRKGILVICYLAWIENSKIAGKATLRDYCRKLVTLEYSSTADKMMDDLKAMSKDSAVKWIRDTYDQYFQ